MATSVIKRNNVDTAIVTTGSAESLGANVNAALSSLNSKIATFIKTKSIDGTTDSVGDVELGLSPSQYIPISFRVTGGEVNKTSAILFLQTTNGASWWVKFISDNTLQNQASKTVTGTLYYLEI